MTLVDARAQVERIQVLHITRSNRKRGFTLLGDLIRASVPGSFFSLDTEFSGLGSDARLLSSDLVERYEAFRKLVNARAVLALGIASFIPCASDEILGEHPRKYTVTVLHFVLRCENPWECVSSSGEFLVAHGFDFNELFLKGIPYIRASAPEPKDRSRKKALKKSKFRGKGDANMPFSWAPLPRGLLWRIGRAGVPLVVHNGLTDLALMYTAFQGELPPTLNGFAVALLECVPGGFWDTKVLSTEISASSQSFLSFLFAEAVLDGTVNVQPNESVNKAMLEKDTKAARRTDKIQSEELCSLYALQGFCPREMNCCHSHDPFLAVTQVKQGLVKYDMKVARKSYKEQGKADRRLRKGGGPGVGKLNKKAKKRLLAAQLAEVSIGKKDSNTEPYAASVKDSHVQKTVSQTETCPRCQRCTLCTKEGAQGDTITVSESEELQNVTESEDGMHAHKTNKRNAQENGAAGDVESSGRENRQQIHNAGWDALSTGYIFIHFSQTAREAVGKLRNRIYLLNMSSTLLLCRSKFDVAPVFEKECVTSKKAQDQQSPPRT